MYERSIYELEAKLYSRCRDFKNFNNIDNVKKEQIKKDVLSFQEKIQKKLRSTIFQSAKLEKYKEALLYLTSPSIHLTYPTFDEKILFLIYCIDPDLVIFTEYIKANIPSEKEIEKLSPEEQEKAFIIRHEGLAELKDVIHQQIGITNLRLLNYESVLYRKNYKTFQNNIRINFLNRLLTYTKDIKDFDSIEDSDFNRINMIAIYYLSKVNNDTTPNTTAFNILTQNKMLLLKNIAEQIVFFITVCDPDLNLLRIFEEESMLQETERRAKEELGYYDFNLIKLEKAYHKRFCPDKKVSIWTI